MIDGSAHQWLRWGVGWVLVLLSFVAKAQSTTDWSRWQGATEGFRLRDGILSVADDAATSPVSVWCDYSLGTAKAQLFTLDCLFGRLPSSRNRFEWQPFSITESGHEYPITVEPAADGASVNLYQRDAMGRKQMLSHVLLPSPLSDWQELKISLEHSDDALRLSVSTASGRVISSNPAALVHKGAVQSRMKLTAFFTKNEKKHLNWRLPTAETKVEDTPPEDIALLNIAPQESGEVFVTFDRPVDTSGARVHCIGFLPSIRLHPTDPSTAIVSLGEPFKSGQNYTFVIKGLKSSGGKILSDVTFEVSTEEEDPRDFGAWQGEREKFRLKGDVLSVAPDAEPPVAYLTLSYSEEDRVRTFEMTSMMERTPTSRNTFEWQLFVIKSDPKSYAYIVRPASDGKALNLWEDILSGEETTSRKVLTFLPIQSPEEAWQLLPIQVVRDADGISLSIREHGDIAVTAPPVPLTRQGAFVGEMKLTAKYTKSEKEKLHWRLPTVEERGEIIAPPVVEVRILTITPREEGQVEVRLDAEVDISRASVLCDGYVPTLSLHPTLPRTLVIDLGERFRPASTYTFTVRGLRTAVGREVGALSFEVVTEEVPEPPAPEVHILAITPHEAGQIDVQLNSAVAISHATVLCPGFTPVLTLHPTLPNTLVIDLGEALRPATTYTCSIAGLRTPTGEEVGTLSFEVVTEDAPLPPQDTDKLEGWSGDISHFVVRGEVLSIAEGTMGTESRIDRTYGGDGTAWEYTLTCLFERIPSTRNTFRWDLFGYADDTETRTYFVRPNGSGSALLLCEEVHRANVATSSDPRTLATLNLRSPLSSWGNLPLSITHTRKGVVLKATEGSNMIATDTVKIPKDGAFVPTMTFTARYTTNEKTKLHWTIPTASPTADDVEVPDIPDNDSDIPVEDSDPLTDWSGDTAHFVVRGEVLSIAQHAIGEESRIGRTYGGDGTAWEYTLTCLFERIPSTRNMFRWDLFGYADDTETRTYFVRPNGSGSALLLCEEVRPTTASSPSSPRTLATLNLRSPLSSWGNLPLSITHTRKGVVLKATEGSNMIATDTVKIPKNGTFVPTMTFTARYTTNEKTKLHWTIPAASPAVEDPAEPESPTEPDVPEPPPAPAPLRGLYISEIMADPPGEGDLEGLKYIELYNASEHILSLSHYRLLYKSTVYALPETELPPDAYLVLLSVEDVSSGTIPSAVGMEKFPALSGSFSLKLIEQVSGEEVDVVRFSGKLYGQGYGRGGASVERLAFSGTDDYWCRSQSRRKGTPGSASGMRHPVEVHPSTVIINELMLSPSAGGEKYIELHNKSNQPIALEDLYLRYSNHPDGDRTPWLLVTMPVKIAPGGYVVLTPFPETLVRLYPGSVDATVLVERIDFPSISATYSEIELCAHLDDKVIDRAVYRRQYLGDTSGERTGYALERISPSTDGGQRSSWRRALKDSGGGTPGRVNSVHGYVPHGDEEAEAWPADPEMDLRTMLRMSRLHPDRLSLDVYALSGQSYLRASGSRALVHLDELLEGASCWNTAVYIVSVRIAGEGELHDLYYRAKWLLRVR